MLETDSFALHSRRQADSYLREVCLHETRHSAPCCLLSTVCLRTGLFIGYDLCWKAVASTPGSGRACRDPPGVETPTPSLIPYDRPDAATVQGRASMPHSPPAPVSVLVLAAT